MICDETFSVTRTNSLPCRLYVPDEAPAAPLPLVTFLHGAGERGTDPALLSVHGPFRRIAEGWRPDFLCLAPQCPEGVRWTDLTEPLGELIQSTADRLGADRSRLYLTGISMGGFGIWAMLARWPKLFAAAVPICGGGQPWAASEFASVPVRVFHGDADGVVDCHYSVDMVTALKARGGDAELTLYPGVGHDSWTQTYENPDVWAWLLAQKKA